jgi:hypothetical protein
MQCFSCENDPHHCEGAPSFLLESEGDILHHHRLICSVCAVEYRSRGYRLRSVGGKTYLVAPERGEALLSVLSQQAGIQQARIFMAVFAFHVFAFLLALVIATIVLLRPGPPAPKNRWRPTGSLLYPSPDSSVPRHRNV